MSSIFESKFGFFPKKIVKADNKNIYIGSNEFMIKDIQCIFYRPFNFTKNEWGTVYLSLNGENYDANDIFAKNVFKFTKKQNDLVLEFLETVNIPVVQKGNDLNAMPLSKIKETKVILKCPECESINVDFIQNNKKNFSVGKAAAGAVLTGGVGNLAGFAGKKGNNQWHCKACGHIFETKSK